MRREVGMSYRILRDDEYWLVRTFGPRFFQADSKVTGEHRLYWTRDAVERDFSGSLNWHTEAARAAGEAKHDD